jgi:hypothetical protein
MSRYTVGAALPGWEANAPQGRGILINVTNMGALIKSQGGGMGVAAAAILPATIENKVYGDMAKQIQEAFRSKGIDQYMQVSQVASSNYKPPFSRRWGDMAIGAGVAGVAVLTYKLIFGRKHK